MLNINHLQLILFHVLTLQVAGYHCSSIKVVQKYGTKHFLVQDIAY
jgi:hypothetical protein